MTRLAMLCSLLLGACAPTHTMTVAELDRGETWVPATRIDDGRVVSLERGTFAVQGPARDGRVSVGRRGTHHPMWKAGTALWIIGTAAAAPGIGLLAQPDCGCGGLTFVGVGLAVPGIVMVLVGVPLMAAGGAAQPRELSQPLAISW
jgi:hypothetical protein